MSLTSSQSFNLKDSSPVWPLPAIDGKAPTIVERRQKMPGVHIAYESSILRLTPVFAVASGRIIYASKQDHGHTIIVDHCNGWATYYTNLEHMFAAPRTSAAVSRAKVKSGDVLGYVDTKQRAGEQCLYFELWRRVDGHFEPDDVEQHLSSWAMLPWTVETLKPIDTASIAA